MKTNILFSEKIFSIALFIGCLVLFPDVPLWAFASSIFFWLWRLVLESQQLTIPSRFLTGFISIIFLVATLYSFRTFIGKEAATCFLIILSSLKILEYREKNEKNFLVLLGLFIVSSKFLFSLDLIFTLIEIPLFLIMMYTMIPDGYKKKPLPFKITFLSRHLFLSLPMALFLYFFFPRFTQDWIDFHNYSGGIGLTGMSDEVRPGSVSKLVQSNEVAFRAEFKEKQPQNVDLYWRAQILTIPNGLIWKKDPSLRPQHIPYLEKSSVNWNFKVTIEPHHRNWIFTPEKSDNIQSEQIRLNQYSNGLIISAQPIEKRSIYYGTWSEDIKTHIPSNAQTTEDRIDKSRKINFSDSVIKIVSEIKKSSKNAEDFARLLLEYYEKNGFKYTLQPGDKGDLKLENFLFESKKGFCEHYASVSALLFLAAGYPARVVAGYQGGTFNQFGNYWTIQQKDAHAWTEYLDSKNLWTRFDATTVVAPLRLDLGAARFLELKDEDLANINLSVLKKKFDGISFIDRIEFLFDNLNYQWNTFILDYDLEKQKQILNDLNINIGVLALVALVLVGLFSVTLNWYFRKDTRESSEIIYDMITNFFSPFNLERKNNEGPVHWRNRIIAKYPRAKEQIIEIFENYIEESFNQKRGRMRIKKIKILLSNLAPSLK